MLGLRRGKIEIQIPSDNTPCIGSSQFDSPPRRRRVAAGDHDRLRAEYVRDALRVHVGDRKVSPFDVDVRQQRVADTLVKPFCGSRAVIFERNILDLTPARLRHLVEQVPDSLNADAKGKHAGRWKSRDLADDLGFVADITIGHEAHYTNARASFATAPVRL